MRKKIVWLPYDMDTAIGINNEGALVFSYNLEDIDHTGSGANIFNGQESVMWTNLRDAFGSELKTMYQQLRSQGKLSYSVVEQAFEDHQSKWPEAVFNEDAWFKYLQPLVEDGDASYLSMLQGSKAEQRKWWLYNRFRYMDSKYNAGDALTDVITLRGYAKSNVVVRPYADVYASVKYGSYLVQTRAARNQNYTLTCPLDEVNDTEIYIYSASQLAAVGDLSGFKVGYANFSMATKLQSLKIGDSDDEYENGNLTELYLGNNALLHDLDARNCPNLTMPVDISGCTNIENVYFDGTSITGLTLPNGGILKKLHVPDTLTNLTIRNQPALTEFVIPTGENITTLRLENVGTTLDSKSIVSNLAASSRVRLIGFSWTFTDYSEASAMYDTLDTMRGLDEAGGNMDHAQMMGTIHIPALTGTQMASLLERYPDISVTYDHITSYLYYYNFDGTTLLNTETIYDGGNGTYSGTPARTSNAQYDFTFAGWARTMDSYIADPTATQHIEADRNVYAAYSTTVRTYTVTWKNDDNTTLETDTGVAYGTTPTYNGSTPVSSDSEMGEFIGWTPDVGPITGDATYTATFMSPVEVIEITDDWATIISNIANGVYKTEYKLGNYKPLDLGTEGIVDMQIVAFDRDIDAEGNTVPVTMISKLCMPAQKLYSTAFVEQASDSYLNSDVMKPYLENTILPIIQLQTNNRIVSVRKSMLKSDGTTTNALLPIWIPSAREIVGTNAYENEGAIYNVMFRDQSSRIKSNMDYWLRSRRNSQTTYHILKSNGTISYASSAYIDGTVPGFCLGPDTIHDTWDEISSHITDGDYATVYSIGDTKAVDMGDQGIICFQIAAFDADVDENENTIPITWVAEQALKTKRGMNSTDSTSGGYQSSTLKTYVDDLESRIPATLKSMIVGAVKTSKNSNPSAMRLWIPSVREIFGGTNSEQTGPIYSSIFSDTESRKRRIYGGDFYDWWLRTPVNGSNSSYYRSGTSAGATTASGVVLGFCTGAKTE